MVICKRCGTESPEEFRFCPGCGAPLPEASAPRQARKVVTALFCDVTGSTALGEELDPEVYRGVLNRYFAEIRRVIERHGGTVDEFRGDSVMAVFGIPRVQEDDALRAVRAAAEIRERLPALAQEVGVALQFRTGVNTGPVLMSEGENLAVGDAVNVAARLEQAAAPGEIVLGSETLRLVRDAVQVEPLDALALKGKSEPVTAFRLVSVDPVAPGVARHLDAPLIGRESELHLLRDAWDRVIRERGCHLFTLLGTAGVGKSRLVKELLAGVGETATVLRGRCLHYGEGITFWPLVEALAELGERAERVLNRLDTGGAAVPEELFWEVRRLLETLALERPVILHIDDLHWAQPMLLDLLDHVVDLSRGAPILLLCAARPELLEDRTGWAGGKLNASTVLLESLNPAESDRLLAGLGDGLDPDARARVVAASEGNPLFLEEMVALARERGTIAVPSTIQALLAARLERLADGEREVLERGAVEGEVFHRLAVRALAGEPLRTEVELRLSGLVRKELIRPHTATFRDDEAFRFRHLLIRDAAYDGLPKSERAELHERFARWLEQSAAELREVDEIAGWHLEQAVVYQRELGRVPDALLLRDAAEHLHAAGRRAAALGDSSAAQNLLERSMALAWAERTLGAQIAVDLAEQLTDSGDLARAEELLSAVEQDPEVAGLAALTRFEWLIAARPQEANRTISSRLPGMLERLTHVGDQRGLAKAHMAAWWAHWVVGRATAAGEEARLAAAHAQAAGDEGLRSRAVAAYMATLVFGKPHATQIAHELDTIGREDHGPYLAAIMKRDRGWLCCLEGRFDEAIELTKLAMDDLNALGLPMRAALCNQRIADIEFSAGRPDKAIEVLERADETLAELGERTYRSTMQAYLAEAYELVRDPAAARVAIELAVQLSAPDDALNYAIVDGVRARLALIDGDGDAAERWARSAIQHTLKTDFLLDEARARLNLARVLAALGRREQAAREGEAALELYQTKGDLPGTTRARALVEEMSVTPE